MKAADGEMEGQMRVRASEICPNGRHAITLLFFCVLVPGLIKQSEVCVCVQHGCTLCTTLTVMDQLYICFAQMISPTLFRLFSV